ncbi:MAG: hypothetical protein Q4C14_04715 [Bacillota bacterium]|nr:hypothetical protein [Bacillota bacterium]
MWKRYTGIIISVIMIFSMTVTSFAELSAKLDVKISVGDYSYTLMATVSDAGDSQLTYQWYECEAGGANPVIIPGAEGNVYQPEKSADTKYYYCQVTAASGEESNVVNTDIAEVKDKSAGLKEEEPKKEIMTFSVKDIDAPVTGEKPDLNASTGLGDPGFIISNIEWSPSHSEFKPETEYSVTVTVKISEGCAAGEGFKCFINDNAALASGNPDSGELSFKYTFPATEAAEDTAEPEEETGIADALPAPLGIPGWIWVVIIAVLVIALIAAVIANVKAKKRKAGRKNYVNEIYEEKMRKKETMRIDAEEIRKSESEVTADNNNISYYDINEGKSDSDSSSTAGFNSDNENKE